MYVAHATVGLQHYSLRILWLGVSELVFYIIDMYELYILVFIFTYDNSKS